MLCTTKVYVGTELHYETSFACLLSTTKILYYASATLCAHCVFSLQTFLEKSAPENHVRGDAYFSRT